MVASGFVSVPVCHRLEGRSPVPEARGTKEPQRNSGAGAMQPHAPRGACRLFLRASARRSVPVEADWADEPATRQLLGRASSLCTVASPQARDRYCRPPCEIATKDDL